MSSKSFATELSRNINAEARLRFPAFAKNIGRLTTMLPTRLFLRFNTPYPYSFREDDDFFPRSEEGSGFGRVIRSDRQEGLQEIHSSIETQTKERQWVFVPEEKAWIDTTLRSFEARADTDGMFPIYLSHLYAELEYVHAHPDITARRIATEEPSKFSENYLLEASQPSISDIRIHNRRVWNTPAHTQQVSSIISHYGVTSLRTIDRDQGARIMDYDRQITGPTDPIQAIRELLGRMSMHILGDEGLPTLNVKFEPLRTDTNSL